MGRRWREARTCIPRLEVSRARRQETRLSPKAGAPSLLLLRSPGRSASLPHSRARSSRQASCRTECFARMATPQHGRRTCRSCPKRSRCRRRQRCRGLLLTDKGSRASAHARRAGNPDRPARRQAHGTGRSPRRQSGGPTRGHLRIKAIAQTATAVLPRSPPGCHRAVHAAHCSVAWEAEAALRDAGTRGAHAATSMTHSGYRR
jgi:hypothetical protein